MTSAGICQILKDHLEPGPSVEIQETQVQIEDFGEIARATVKRSVVGGTMRFKVLVILDEVTDEIHVGA